jgi:hypothetical protein
MLATALLHAVTDDCEAVRSCPTAEMLMAHDTGSMSRCPRGGRSPESGEAPRRTRI